MERGHPLRQFYVAVSSAENKLVRSCTVRMHRSDQRKPIRRVQGSSTTST